MMPGSSTISSKKSRLPGRLSERFVKGTSGPGDRYFSFIRLKAVSKYLFPAIAGDLLSRKAVSNNNVDLLKKAKVPAPRHFGLFSKKPD